MNQESEPLVSGVRENDEMRPEYDFSGGVRGKYYEAYMQASKANNANHVIILDPDVAEIFLDSASVNEALRLLAKIAKSTTA